MTTKVKSKKTIKFKDIKSPKTVEEFRENIRKYYCVDFDDTLMNGVGEKVVIDELNSMEELHECGVKKKQWSWNGSDFDHPPFSLTPTIVLEKKNKDKTKYLNENEILWNKEEFNLFIEKVCKEFWEDEDNFTIYENDQWSFVKHQDKTHKNVYWLDYWKNNTLYWDWTLFFPFIL